MARSSGGNVSDQVWGHMLDAKFNLKYLKALRRRYSRRDLWIRLFIAIASSSTVAGWAIWSDFPSVWLLVSAVATLVAVASPILAYPKLIGTLGELYGGTQRAEMALERLWDRIQAGTTVTLTELDKAQEDVPHEQSEADIPEDEKLKIECQRVVCREMGLPMPAP